MKLVFVGTNSGIPSLERNQNAAVVVFEQNQMALLDCGEGTQMNLMKSNKVRHMNIRYIFITHLHGDHCYGLPGLMFLLFHDLKKRTDDKSKPVKVKIVGPKGLFGFINGVLIASHGQHVLPLFEIIELDSKQEIHKLNNIIDNVEITAMRLVHCGMPTFGYYFKENDRAGKLDAEKAKSLGAKFEQMGALKSGKDVILDNGEIIYSKDVVGEPITGYSLAILQDVSIAENAINYLKDKKVNILMHECTFDKAKEEEAKAFGHSTSTMAGRNAT